MKKNFIGKLLAYLNKLYRSYFVFRINESFYSRILKCFDHETKEQCCLKIVKNNKKELDQAKIEIQILEFIKNKNTNNECHILRIFHNFSFMIHIIIIH